jgi:UDP-glucose 4-epimerase
MAAERTGARRRRRAGEGQVIAVTGVHGSLARRLLRRLDDDARVARLVLIDRRVTTTPLFKAASYRVDLTEPNADGHLAEILRREEASAVVHLAFWRRPGRDHAAEHALESVGTMHVIGAVAQAAALGGRLGHLVVISSGLVYGAHPEAPAVLTEAEPLRGGLGYPFVDEKVDAERQVEAARPHVPVPITVLRPAVTLGPGSDGVAATYFGGVFAPTVWGYDPLVQLLHEEDVVEACRAVLGRRPNGVYNLAGSGALPLGTLLRLSGAVPVPLLACSAPATLETLWRFGLSPVPGGHIPYLRYPLVLDGERAARELGFRPRRSTVEVLEHFLGRRLAGPA